ncbi:hypothetical protein AJ78_01171 [Emergomyces pasteurianus Ep9510]|uniref:Uncharacterized protein n=1 Tax=Emergomyces pasteurianus Ep9510 TaxID=1447872 RepID=A0A1J9PRJ1_9EURO|nr:hypothetical protein AJ78_01171 [Emergomyces pasteurianus Ep9510]
MPQFRNFFPKRPAVNVIPASDEPAAPQNTLGSGRDGSQRASLTLRRSTDEQPHEYKMSVVDDSGVYLPPSPTEKKSFWHRSSSQNNTRSLVDENEPFPISRESFDSYRRSFDISARSPISQSDTAASRTSLDSRFSRLTTPRSTISGHTLDTPPKFPYEVREHEHEHAQEQGQFVDVGLNEDTKPKKKGFFARFGDNAMTTTTTTTTTSPSAAGPATGGTEAADNSRPSSSHLSLGFYLPGRKREQSGAAGASSAASAGGFQVAELGSMKIPVSADVK